MEQCDESGEHGCVSLASAIPRGICPLLLHNALPYWLTLSRGGMFPWIPQDQQGEVELQCPNPGGAAVLRLRSSNGGPEVSGVIKEVRGHCVFGHEPGDRIDLAALSESPLSLGDLNSALSWVLPLCQTDSHRASPPLIGPTGRNSIKLSNPASGGQSPPSPCPDVPPFKVKLAFFQHRCRYHKWPKREEYSETTWLPPGVCPELFHQLYLYSLSALYSEKGIPEELVAGITCPASHRVTATIAPRKASGYPVRAVAQEALIKCGMITEIPLKELDIRVVKVEGPCPFNHTAGQTIPFNMMRLPSLCPACFHSIYPPLRASWNGGPPWMNDAPHFAIQCPDSFSAITLAVPPAAKGRDL